MKTSSPDVFGHDGIDFGPSHLLLIDLVEFRTITFRSIVHFSRVVAAYASGIANSYARPYFASSRCVLSSPVCTNLVGRGCPGCTVAVRLATSAGCVTPCDSENYGSFEFATYVS